MPYFQEQLAALERPAAKPEAPAVEPKERFPTRPLLSNALLSTAALSLGSVFMNTASSSAGAAANQLAGMMSHVIPHLMISSIAQEIHSTSTEPLEVGRRATTEIRPASKVLEENLAHAKSMLRRGELLEALHIILASLPLLDQVPEEEKEAANRAFFKTAELTLRIAFGKLKTAPDSLDYSTLKLAARVAAITKSSLQEVFLSFSKLTGTFGEAAA